MKKNRSENSTSPFFTDLESRGHSINDGWKPAAASCKQLEAAGLDRRYIQGNLRVQFILSCQNQDIRNGNWNKLFVQYAKQQLPTTPVTGQQYQQPQPNEGYQHPARTGQTYNSSSSTTVSARRPSTIRASDNSRAIAMSDDWRPSDEMVKLILATICPNREYLKTQLISFTSHFHSQYNPNWDQQFRKWINNGWNVYGHRKNFNSNNKDERDFVEKHTDTSWREGL